MIIDRIENCQKYATLGPRFGRAFEILQTFDFSTCAAGRYDVEPDELYFLVQEYQSKPLEEGKIEAHRQYADIQAVLQGRECIGYADLGALQPGEYSPERDFLPAEGPVDLVTVAAGSFMVLFPNDAHMPGLRCGESEPVRKVVFKVRL